MTAMIVNTITILINTKIRKERKEKERNNDAKALELLNDIL